MYRDQFGEFVHVYWGSKVIMASSDEREFRFVLVSGNVSDFSFELLHDRLYCFNNIPDVIAVTETRIDCNTSANIDLPNYKFYQFLLLVVLVFTSHPP